MKLYIEKGIQSDNSKLIFSILDSGKNGLQILARTQGGQSTVIAEIGTCGRNTRIRLDKASTSPTLSPKDGQHISRLYDIELG